MARIRTIKPETPQSESFGRLSRDARLCFIMLWTISDDAGRARGSSRLLASLLYPYDSDAKDLMEGWLYELEEEGCIRRYEIDGDQFLEICKWLKHQKIDKPSPSRLPPFDEASQFFSKPREPSTTDLVPGPVPRPGTEVRRLRQQNSDSQLEQGQGPILPSAETVSTPPPVPRLAPANPPRKSEADAFAEIDAIPAFMDRRPKPTEAA